MAARGQPWIRKIEEKKPIEDGRKNLSPCNVIKLLTLINPGYSLSLNVFCGENKCTQLIIRFEWSFLVL